MQGNSVWLEKFKISHVSRDSASHNSRKLSIICWQNYPEQLLNFFKSLRGRATRLANPIKLNVHQLSSS